MFMLSIIPGIAMFGMGTGVPGGTTLSSGMEQAPGDGFRTLAILSSRDAATWGETIPGFNPGLNAGFNAGFNASPTLCRRLSFSRRATLSGWMSWQKAAPQPSKKRIRVNRIVLL